MGSISVSGESAYRLSQETRDQLVKYVEAKQKEVIAILFKNVTELDLKDAPPAIKKLLDVYSIKVQATTTTPSESSFDKVEIARALAFAVAAKALPIIGFVGVLGAYSGGAVVHYLYQRFKAANLESLKSCAAPAAELVFEPTNQRCYYKDALNRPMQLAEVIVVQEACRAYEIALEILDLDERGRISLCIEELYRKYLIFGELDTKIKIKASEQRYFHDGSHIERKSYDPIIKLIMGIQASLPVMHKEIIESINLLAPHDPRPEKTLNLEPGNFPDEFTHCKSIPKGRTQPKKRRLMPSLKCTDYKDVKRFPDYTYVSEEVWLTREMEDYADISDGQLVHRDTAKICSKQEHRSKRREECLKARENYFSTEESKCRKEIRKILNKMFYEMTESELFRALNRYKVRPITLAMFPKDSPLVLKQIIKNGRFSFQDRLKEDALEKTLRRNKEEVALSRAARNEFVYLDSEPEDPFSDDYIDQSLRAYLNQLLSDCLTNIEKEAKRWTGDEPFKSTEEGNIIHENRRTVWGRVVKKSKLSQIPQTLEETFLKICRQETLEETAKYALVLGCGVSQSVITLLEKGWHVVCVDFSNDVIEAMRSHVNEQQNQCWINSGKLKFVCKKIENYKSDEKFDLVLANACLSYCNPRKIGTILKNVFQSLNPGCHFLGDFLTDELLRDKHERLIVDRGSVKWEREMGGWFMKDRRSLLVLLASCGFEVIRCLKCDPAKSTDDPKSYFFTAFKRKPIDRNLMEEASPKPPKIPKKLFKRNKRALFSLEDRLREDEQEQSLSIYKAEVASSLKTKVEFISHEEPKDRLSDEYINWSLKTHLNQALNDCMRSIQAKKVPTIQDTPGAGLLPGQELNPFKDPSEEWAWIVNALGPTSIPGSLKETFLKISEETIGQESKCALVLGCGLSQSAVHLLKKGWNVVCVDFSHQVIMAMHKYVSQQELPMDKLRLVCAKIENYKPDDKFDLVLANSCLSYCDPEQMGPLMQYLNTCLNPGCYFLGDFLSQELIGEEGYLQRHMGAWFIENQRHIQVLLAGHGFRVVKCINAGKSSGDDPNAYYFTAFKP